MQDYIEGIGPLEEQAIITTDGAYSGSRIDEKAADSNVPIINTNLIDCEGKDIAADLKFNEEGTRVIECPNGKDPQSSSCSKGGVCTGSVRKGDCENCPFRDQCDPNENAKAIWVTITTRTQQRHRSSDRERRMSSGNVRISE